MHLSPNLLFLSLSRTGIGIARGNIDDPILGEDSDSYAVQINEHPKATCINTKNRVQIKRTSPEVVHSNVGVMINLDEHLLNIYLNGKATNTGNQMPLIFLSVTFTQYNTIQNLYLNTIMLKALAKRTRKSTQVCKTRTCVRTCEGWPNGFASRLASRKKPYISRISLVNAFL